MKFPPLTAAVILSISALPMQAMAQTATAPQVSQQAQDLVNKILAAQPPFTGDAALGCKILLCLANPNGPEAVTECIQPIQTLWHILSETPPGQIPTCPMASTPGNKNYATQAVNYYNACPAGMTPLPAGAQAALQGQPVTYSWVRDGDDGYSMQLTGVSTGIGDGVGLTPDYGGRDGNYTPLQPMTCVGQQVGTITPKASNSMWSWYGANPPAIPVYNQITTIQPGMNGRAIDVFINSALHNVVHY